MCKYKDTTLGIKKIDFTIKRGNKDVLHYQAVKNL